VTVINEFTEATIRISLGANYRAVVAISERDLAEDLRLTQLPHTAAVEAYSSLALEAAYAAAGGTPNADQLAAGRLVADVAMRTADATRDAAFRAAELAHRNRLAAIGAYFSVSNGSGGNPSDATAVAWMTGYGLVH
jgi:hypothetical protein